MQNKGKRVGRYVGNRVRSFVAWWHAKRAGSVVGAVAVVGIVLAAVVAAIVYQVNHPAKGSHADTAPAPATVTVTSTVTVAGKATHWEEDSLPDEMYRWLDAHHGELAGPSHADMYAAGHHECWAAWTSNGQAGLLMCPDGYQITW
jgi:hypothetical protein